MVTGTVHIGIMDKTVIMVRSPEAGYWKESLGNEMVLVKALVTQGYRLQCWYEPKWQLQLMIMVT